MARIMIVDDQDDIRRFLYKLLGCAGGHIVTEALDGVDALGKAATHPPDLVISDLLMPSMDGFELVRQLRSRPALKHTAVIFYTAAFAEQEVKELASACGAIHFVQKPCRPGVLLRAVKEALNLCQPNSAQPLDHAEFNANHLMVLTNKLSLKVAELEDTNRRLAEAYDTTLEGWVRALDMRDKETEGHTQRVTQLTLALARAVDFAPADMVNIRRGALLHDIGKLGVPDAILFKPGPLTAGERAIMEKHPVQAYDMLRPILYLRDALDIPYCHHERWDGTGYPRGLSGTEIPLSARAFALADVWDALSSDRPYRAAWQRDKVRRYVREQRGKHFDPDLTELFLALPETERAKAI